VTPLESREKGIKFGENIRDPLKENSFKQVKKEIIKMIKQNWLKKVTTRLLWFHFKKSISINF
jgi:hypothetical protein